MLADDGVTVTFLIPGPPRASEGSVGVTGSWRSVQEITSATDATAVATEGKRVRMGGDFAVDDRWCVPSSAGRNMGTGWPRDK